MKIRHPLKLTAGICAVFALSACTGLNAPGTEDAHPNLHPVRMPDELEMKALRDEGCLFGQIIKKYPRQKDRASAMERCLRHAPKR